MQPSARKYLLFQFEYSESTGGGGGEVCLIMQIICPGLSLRNKCFA